MNVQLRYYAQVRQAAGTEDETAAVAPGTDVIDALRSAASRHGEAFRDLVLAADGQLRASIIVLVNSVPVRRGSRRMLAEGDEVSVFSPVAGG